MKDFKQFLNEQLNSRVEIRDSKSPTSSHGVDNEHKSKIIGWFSNTHNRAQGWVITTLSPYDSNWVKSKGHNPSEVFRTFTSSGNTSMIKINAKTGTYAFADNKHLEDSDELRFEKSTKFSKLVIDSGKEKAFGL